MTRYILTFWSGNVTVVNAESIREAAIAGGYSDEWLDSEGHLWLLDDGTGEVTNSDGDSVCLISADFTEPLPPIEFTEFTYHNGQESHVVKIEDDDEPIYRPTNVAGYNVVFPTNPPASCQWFTGIDRMVNVRESLKRALSIGEAHPATENFGRKIIVSAIRQGIVRNPYYKIAGPLQVVEAFVTTKPDTYGCSLFVTVIYNSEKGWATSLAGKVENDGHVKWECYAD